MADNPGSGSLWPVFVALGAVTTEVGVLFGFVPIAVGGVLLFGISCAGVVHDAGYAENVWRPLRIVGAVIGAAGGGVWLSRSTALTPDALRTAAITDPFAVRAAVVLAAAVVLVVAGLVAPAFASSR